MLRRQTHGDATSKGVTNNHQWTMGDLLDDREQQCGVVASSAGVKWRSGRTETREVQGDRAHALGGQLAGRDRKISSLATPAMEPRDPHRLRAVRFAEDRSVSVDLQHTV